MIFSFRKATNLSSVPSEGWLTVPDPNDLDSTTQTGYGSMFPHSDGQIFDFLVSFAEDPTSESDLRVVRGIIQAFSEPSDLLLSTEGGNLQQLPHRRLRSYKQVMPIPADPSLDANSPYWSLYTKLDTSDLEGKLLVINTGGTISSSSSAGGGVSPGNYLQNLFQNTGAKRSVDIIYQQMDEMLDSTDIGPYEWFKLYGILNQQIKAELPDGIVILHGTDTMMYSSSMLAFQAQNQYCPIVYIGAQRSTDRPSTEALDNIVRGARYALRGQCAEVMTGMAGNISADHTMINRAVRVMKTNSAARNTFQTVDGFPVAMVGSIGRGIFKNSKEEPIKEFPHYPGEFYRPRGAKTASMQFLLNVGPMLDKDDKVPATQKAGPMATAGFYWTYPGEDLRVMQSYIDNFTATVIPGVGFGHVERHGRHEIIIKQGLDKGKIIIMGTQIPTGGSNIDVYTVGRELGAAGAWNARSMIPTVAYTKIRSMLSNLSDADTGLLLNFRRKSDPDRQELMERLQRRFEANTIGELNYREIYNYNWSLDRSIAAELGGYE